MNAPKDIEKYESHYSESKFGAKLPRIARRAGAKLVYCALLLFYVLKSPAVSSADKTMVYGALGYLLLPMDLLPDFLPLAGYADDLSALIWALHTVWKNITPEIKAQAAAKTREWFGDFDEKKIDEQIMK